MAFKLLDAEYATIKPGKFALNGEATDQDVLALQVSDKEEGPYMTVAFIPYNQEGLKESCESHARLVCSLILNGAEVARKMVSEAEQEDTSKGSIH